MINDLQFFMDQQSKMAITTRLT